MNKNIDLHITKLHPQAKIPDYKHQGDSGMDVYAPEPFYLKAQERKLIKLGIAIAIPDGCEIQVRSRSGLAFKKGLFVLNSPGTVDSSYTGELGVILANFGDSTYFNDGYVAIAQLVLVPVCRATLIETEKLDEAESGKTRLEAGFGSTGS